jgi:hypothetical protein
VTRATVQCSLDDYAAATRLPTDFLIGLGLTESGRNGTKRVSIPYRDVAGRDRGSARCLAPPAGSRADRWERPTDLGIYGLEQLRDHHDELVVVAHELEAQTLRFHGFPALAVTDTAWRGDWPATLNSVTAVYVVVSHGTDDMQAPAWLDAAPFKGKAQLVSLPGQLPLNGIHRDTGEQFNVVWNAITGSAVAVATLQHQALQQRRATALTRSGALACAEDILGAFGAALRDSGYAGDLAPAKLVYLVATSRLLAQPVSAVVKGLSSAGKSFLVKRVLEFFPESAYYAITAMSDRALVYSSEPLEHRMLVLAEAGGLSEPAELMVRSLLSEGRVAYDTVIDLKGVKIRREGPTGLITTTTKLGLHPENETRLLSITLPDDPDRIRQVLLAIATQADTVAADYAPWHALQDLLAASDAAVYVPFARDLATAIPPVSMRLQRDFTSLLGLISSHALLHQETRPRDEQGRVVAALADYAAVWELVHDVVAEGAEQSVPRTVRETVEAIIDMGPDGKPDGDGLTTTQITAKLGLSRPQVSRRLRRAQSLGYLTERSGTKSGTQKLYALGERLLTADEGVLPSPQALAKLCTRARTPGGVSAADETSGDLPRGGASSTNRGPHC